MELDRISNLPDAITEKILSCLELKEATKTSILSSKWRYKSSTLQSLVFDDTCVSTQKHATFTFVNIVDHVLLLHSGPIYKFELSRKDELAEVDMNRWIIHLHRNAVVKEMTLDNWKGRSFYSFPSCFFSFQDIVYLELYRCLLTPPYTFKGFRSLKSLDLVCVTLAQDVFDNLIAGSPRLVKLNFRHCDGFTNLRIDAPSLQHVIITMAANFEDFSLGNSSNLVDASIELMYNVELRPGHSFGNLVMMFYQLPHIQRLTIMGKLFKYLSIGDLPEKLPKPCHYLQLFSVCMCFDDPYQISAVLCLLKSSPVLQELEILVDSDTILVGEVDSCLYDNYNYANRQLRLVKITKITGVKSQLEFIKFLLSSSPVLERLTVQPATVVGISNLVKELLLFKRDSKHAEIVLLDV